MLEEGLDGESSTEEEEISGETGDRKTSLDQGEEGMSGDDLGDLKMEKTKWEEKDCQFLDPVSFEGI